MIRRISIRLRLTAVALVVAVSLLAASMAIVFLIERSHAQQAVVAEASAAAGDVSRVERELELDDGTEGPDAALRRYMSARSASPTLLYVVDRNGHVFVNAPDARLLAAVRSLGDGQTRTVNLGRARYLVAAARPGNALALAAVPASESETEIGRLLRSMLIVGLGGLVPTLLVAWFAAGSALAPLAQIAHRASRISAGDLSQRVGPVGTRDEVAEVGSTIDAMLDRLEEAFAAQRRLVHDASHELRTPLTIARGHLEVALMQHTAEPEIAEAIDRAISEIDRMARLVDGMLRLARTDAALDHARVPVDELSIQALARVQPLAQRDWRLDVPAEPGVTVLGDRDALEQVLLNLLTNAVRHTADDGMIALRVRTANGSVELRVEDDGEGIGEDVLPFVFDRFTRTDSARTRDRGGAGLGLAICREIVEAHGGTVKVASTPGAGTTFLITLPAAV